MIAIKPICRAQRVRRDGTVKVYLQYCLTSDKRVLLETGIEIPLKHWNKKRAVIMEDLPDPFGDPAELNDSIKRQLRNAEDVVGVIVKRKVNQCREAEFFNSQFQGVAWRPCPQGKSSRVGRFDEQNPS